MLLGGQALAGTEKTVYGYVEKVTLVENNLTITAKLDTGAKTASLSAIKITAVEIDDKPHLKFLVPTKKGNVSFVCEYAGLVTIKPREGESKVHSILKGGIKRPVVKMRINLDNKERELLVNLTNRKRFIYPLLLGRESIKAFDGVVDPAVRFSVKHKKTIKFQSE